MIGPASSRRAILLHVASGAGHVCQIDEDQGQVAVLVFASDSKRLQKGFLGVRAVAQATRLTRPRFSYSKARSSKDSLRCCTTTAMACSSNGLASMKSRRSSSTSARVIHGRSDLWVVVAEHGQAGRQGSPPMLSAATGSCLEVGDGAQRIEVFRRTRVQGALSLQADSEGLLQSLLPLVENVRRPCG